MTKLTTVYAFELLGEKFSPLTRYQAQVFFFHKFPLF